MRKRIKFARLLLLLLLCAGRVAATTVVAVKTPALIVIGADSKMTDTFGGGVGNQGCKIVQAGNLFFAYEGLARDRRTGFDIVKIAAEALAVRPQASPAERVSIMTGFITSRLFEELPDLKRHDPATYREKVEGGQTFLKILVAGFEGGQPLLFVRGFRAAPLNGQAIGVSVLPDDCLADCGGAVVVRMLGETAAIEGLAEETEGFWSGGIAEGVRRLIETEITARSEYVGPPVDLLRIDQTAARWLQKKAECPAIENRRQPDRQTSPRSRSRSRA
ncbi:MAG: hypothetical protein QOF02_2745 [Blastocatellia bacterium]|jgi:hypothetical protein|nr:hypothetical protein [Blastocatellia bacterium]